MRKEQKTAVVGRSRGELRPRQYRAGLRVSRDDGGRDRPRCAAQAARGARRVARGQEHADPPRNQGHRVLARSTSKLGGPVGLILSFDDPVELAKTVTSFKDLGEKFKLRGGVLDGKPLTAEEIQALATLPPREVILAQLLGLLQAPATQLVRLLNEPGSALARADRRDRQEEWRRARPAAQRRHRSASERAPAHAAPSDAAPRSGADVDSSRDAAPSKRHERMSSAEIASAAKSDKVSTASGRSHNLARRRERQGEIATMSEAQLSRDQVKRLSEESEPDGSGGPG